MKKSEIFICFEFETNEKVDFYCKKTTGNEYAETELFNIGRFYFLYTSTRNTNTRSVSLREITHEEFILRKKDILSRRPNKSLTSWLDNGCHTSVKTYSLGKFNKTIASGSCIFITEDNPLKKLFNNVLADENLQESHRKKEDREARYEYAKKCGTLSNRYGVAFVNVMRIGLDITEIKQFKSAYEQVCKQVSYLPIIRQRRIYDALFRGDGKSSRRNMLDELGIPYFKAEPNTLEFTELENILSKNLSQFDKKEEYNAIEKIGKLSKEEALPLYEKILLTRDKRREALKELGIDIECININTFPTEKIKKSLADILEISIISDTTSEKTFY